MRRRRKSASRSENRSDNHAGERFVELAHEALISAWDRMTEWQREEAEWLPLQRTVSQASQARATKRVGLWLTDPRLRTVLQYLRFRPYQLSASETRFVRTSAFFQRAVSLTIGFVAISAVIASVWLYRLNLAANQSRDKAVRARNRALIPSVALRVEQRIAVAGQDELAALLARQAVLFDKKLGTCQDLYPLLPAMRRVFAMPQFSRELYSPSTEARPTSFSPDGRWLASSGEHHDIRLYDQQNPLAKPKSIPLPRGRAGRSNETIQSVAFATRSDGLVASTNQGRIVIWQSLEDAKPRVINSEEKFYGVVRFVDHDRFVVSAVGNSHEPDWNIRIWNARSGARFGPILRIFGNTDTLTYNEPTHQLISSGAWGNEQKILAWNFRDLSRPPVVLGKTDGNADEFADVGVAALAVPLDSPILICASENQAIQEWALSGKTRRSAKLSETLNPPDKDNITDFAGLACSRDGKRVVAILGGRIQVWDQAGPGHRVHSMDIALQMSFSNQIQLSLDGRYVALSAPGGEVSVMDLESGQHLDPIPLGTEGFNSSRTTAVSSDGLAWAATLDSLPLSAWFGSQSKRIPFPYEDLEFAPNAVQFLPGTRRLLALGYQRSYLWTIPIAKTLRPLPWGGEEMAMLSGNRVAVSTDGTIAVRDLHGKTRLICKLADDKNDIPDAAAKPETDFGVTAMVEDGHRHRLVAAYNDGTVRFWDLMNPKQRPGLLLDKLYPGASRLHVEKADLKKSSAPTSDDVGVVTALDVSPDGARLALGYDDGAIDLWDMGTLDHYLSSPLESVSQEFSPSAALTLEPHESLETDAQVSALAFSPEGDVLASCGEDGIVHLYHPGNLQTSSTILARCETGTNDLVWSGTPGKRILGVATDSGQILRYRVSLQELTDDVCYRVSRNMTHEEWSNFIANDIPYESTCPP